MTKSREVSSSAPAPNIGDPKMVSGFLLAVTWAGFVALQTYLATFLAPLAATCASLLNAEKIMAPMAVTTVLTALIAAAFIRSQSRERISQPVITVLCLFVVIVVLASATGGIVTLLAQNNVETFSPSALLGLGVAIPSAYSLTILAVCSLAPRRRSAATWPVAAVTGLLAAGGLALGIIYSLLSSLLCAAVGA